MIQDQLVLTFQKDERGNKPIARSNEGKICFLDIAYCKENNIFVKYNESWRCAISKEDNRKIFVQPITRTLTAEENDRILAEKSKQLASKYHVLR